MELQLTKVIVILRRCFICHEEDFNLERMECCRNYVHKRCLERWMRTLIPSSEKCAVCRKAFRPPHPEAQAADTAFMARIAALCREDHPYSDYEDNCIGCIYFYKELSPFQKHDLAFAIQCILACKTLHEDKNCNHCRRLIEQLVDNYF